MNDKGKTGSEWLHSTLLCEDGKVCATEEMDCTAQVRQIDSFVIVLTHHKGKFAVRAPNGHLLIPEKNKVLHANFMACLRLNIDFIRQVFPIHRFSPYYTLYQRHLGDRHKIWALIHHGDADGLNKVVAALRKDARADAFKKIIDSRQRAARKNADSVIRYIRSLFERHSRLRVIRLDLTYQRKYLETSHHLMKEEGALEDPVTALEVVKHREAFLDHLRAAYPAMVGYVWKIEHGVYKSFHAHWIVFLDGHKVMQDEVIGKAMGEYWRNVITDGRGSYWNVNARKAEYEKRGLLGIGEINYDDTDLRSSLERVVRYLAKVDYFIRVEAPEIDRVFGKGGLRKLESNRAGRPRGSAARQSAPALASPKTGEVEVALPSL